MNEMNGIWILIIFHSTCWLLDCLTQERQDTWSVSQAPPSGESSFTSSCSVQHSFTTRSKTTLKKMSRTFLRSLHFNIRLMIGSISWVMCVRVLIHWSFLMTTPFLGMCWREQVNCWIWRSVQDTRESVFGFFHSRWWALRMQLERTSLHLFSSTHWLTIWITYLRVMQVNWWMMLRSTSRDKRPHYQHGLVMVTWKWSSNSHARHWLILSLLMKVNFSRTWIRTSWLRKNLVWLSTDLVWTMESTWQSQCCSFRYQ